MEKTLTSLFGGAAAKFANKPALRWREEGRWADLSYAALDSMVGEVGGGLMALGVEPGDRVAIFSPNRYEWVAADLAAVSIGAVSVPIYATVSAATAKYILRHSGAGVLLVSDGACLSAVRRIRDEIPTVKHVVLFGDPGPEGAPFALIRFEELRERASAISPERLAQRSARLRGEDLATIVYTSGTTGEPKGVMLTHSNICSNCEAALAPFSVGPSDRTLSFLPLSHVFERTAGLYAMLEAGATIHYLEDVTRPGEFIGEIRPTILFAVPRLLEKFRERVLARAAERPLFSGALFRRAVEHGRRCRERGRAGPLLALYDRLFFRRVRDGFGGCLRFIVCGGAALADEVAGFFEAMNLPVLQGYGLTETSPIVSVNRLEKNKIGTVGPAVAGVEIRIAPDGEVLVRGPNVMKGYFRDPQATAEVLDAQGWLKTGDVGRLDEEGYLRITDRKKEILVTSGGKNVAPQAIENGLKLDPLVGEVCVVGDGKNYLAALIVPNFGELEARARRHALNPGSREDLVRHPLVLRWYEEAIRRFNDGQARYETIKRFALLPKEWTIEGGEITPTLKLRRKTICAMHAETLRSLYE